MEDQKSRISTALSEVSGLSAQSKPILKKNFRVPHAKYRKFGLKNLSNRG